MLKMSYNSVFAALQLVFINAATRRYSSIRFRALGSEKLTFFQYQRRDFTRLAASARSSEIVEEMSKIKVISLDVTGTLLIHKYPIMETYADCARWAKLPNPPSSEELKKPFKEAYFKHLTEFPCFGHDELMSSRDWWIRTVKTALELSGRHYSDAEFHRFFRRVYQHYGSLEGYERLADADMFLENVKSKYMLGITTNTPVRTVETVLPMLGLHNYFKWFVCSRDVGVEKPGKRIFDEAFEQAQFWMPQGETLKRDEVLHIGDSLAADFCGAKASGFQALFLDRSSNPRVTVYQDWLRAPHYDGKSEEDIAKYSISSLFQVSDYLSKSNVEA